MPLRLITKFGDEMLGRLPSAPLDAALDGALSLAETSRALGLPCRWLWSRTKAFPSWMLGSGKWVPAVYVQHNDVPRPTQ